jgi:hypothetical protein
MMFLRIPEDDDGTEVWINLNQIKYVKYEVNIHDVPVLDIIFEDTDKIGFNLFLTKETAINVYEEFKRLIKVCD